MIQDHFRLQREPFHSNPSPEQYFPAASIETARGSLVRLVERDEGPALVVGPVGTGKTLLCQMVAESFRHRCRVVNLPSGRLARRRDLLQLILFELGLSYRSMDEGELRIALIDHVANRDACPNGMLLQVDEADGLSMALLDELRSLTNLTCEGRSCVRVILYGTPRLEEKFTHPRLESFNQRLAGRFYLEPFTLDETSSFIHQAFEDCGGDPHEAFTPEALKKIHRACEGIPRLINQLTDHALLLAASGHHEAVDSACVEEAWADLQQLPMPTEGRFSESTRSIPADIVEFGELNDEDENATGPDAPLAATPGDDLGLAEEFDAPAVAMDAERPVEDGSSELFVSEDPGGTAESLDPSGVTLVFHSNSNPFGDDFEDEEVVIDHFVSPDALAQRHRRQVQSEASEILARQIFKLRQRAASDTACVDQDSNVPHGYEVVDTNIHLECESNGESCAIIPLERRADTSADHSELALSGPTSTKSVSISPPVNHDSETRPNLSRLFSQLKRRHG